MKMSKVITLASVDPILLGQVVKINNFIHTYTYPSTSNGYHSSEAEQIHEEIVHEKLRTILYHMRNNYAVDLKYRISYPLATSKDAKVNHLAVLGAIPVNSILALLHITRREELYDILRRDPSLFDMLKYHKAMSKEEFSSLKRVLEETPSFQPTLKEQTLAKKLIVARRPKL